jgi:hypothetical protein
MPADVRQGRVAAATDELSPLGCAVVWVVWSGDRANREASTEYCCVTEHRQAASPPNGSSSEVLVTTPTGSSGLGVESRAAWLVSAR